MTFIGDIHCKFDEVYYPALQKITGPSIQVGDMGVGFPGHTPLLPQAAQHRFIRGNHDNPEVCAAHPNYMGDFGYEKRIFWMSGAASRDRHNRTHGVNWWPNEELSMEQCYDALTVYTSTDPYIVVTHACPESASYYLGLNGGVDSTRTTQVLQRMFEQHQPAYWIFGHYHMSRRFKVAEFDTQFICLDINEVFVL